MRAPGLYALSLAFAAALLVGPGSAAGQSVPDTVEAHVAAARTAAGQEHTAVFNNLCAPPAPTPPAQQPAIPPQAPPRSEWYVEPAKVFDNLYYLGQSAYSAWG